jgi:hypothetical protein
MARVSLATATLLHTASIVFAVAIVLLAVVLAIVSR